MKKNVIKMLGALSLCFALAGGVSVATSVASANAGVVSISNDKLFIDGTEITAASANFETWHKASVRYTADVDDNGIEKTGMRFLSWINEDVYADLMASEDYTVSFGTLVANQTTLETKEFTKESLENTGSKIEYLDVSGAKIVEKANQKSGEENVEEFSAIVYGIAEANYTTVRMARAYMTVTSVADSEQSVTIYADRTEPEQGDVDARSVADVAYNAIASSKYADVDADQFGALNKYAKKHADWKTYVNEESETVPYDFMSFIDTLEELQRFAAYENMYIKAIDNIDLSNAVWTPSNGSTKNAELTPSCVVPTLNADLDGNGKKMSGLTLTEILKDASGNDYAFNIGFFGTITGTVENLIFDGELGAYDDAGCPIEGCTATTKAVAPIVRQRAGLFAWNNAGTIKNCYITGKIYSVVTADTTIQACVGTIYQNRGTIENVMTDIKFIRGKNTDGHTCETEEENRYGFALAVSNMGTVTNCVTVMSQYETKVNADGVRMWTTTGLDTNSYSNSGKTNYCTWQTNAWNANLDGTLVYARTRYSSSKGTTFYKELAHLDQYRSNCYVFDNYEDLISDTGVGYNDDNQKNFETVNTELLNTSTYTEKTGADGKGALGEGWSFENGKITLCGTVVWQQTA